MSRLEKIEKNQEALKAFDALGQKHKHFIRYAKHPTAEKARDLLKAIHRGYEGAADELKAILATISSIKDVEKYREKSL